MKQLRLFKHCRLLTILAALLFCLLVSSCSTKLDEKKAQEILLKSLPIDSTWKNISIDLTTAPKIYQALVLSGYLEQDPFSGIYKPTSEGMKYIINYDQNQNIIEVRGTNVSSYQIESVTPTGDEAKVSLYAFYGLTPFSAVERAKIRGGIKGTETNDGRLTEPTSLFAFRSYETTFKKQDGDWVIAELEKLKSDIYNASLIK